MHSNRCFNQCDCTYTADLYLFICVMLVLADKLYIPLVLRLLHILNRNILLAIDIYREQIHIAPEDIAHIVELLIQNNITTLKQRIHRVANNIYRTIALRQVGDMYKVDWLHLFLLREQFKRMIADCKRNRIDLIVTKSVSRFARNVMDCIGYVRELKAMNPPIGVLFETEGIFTLDGRSDMQLAFMATTAQEESHNKSEIMNASIEMRFRRGIFLTPKLLGYDLDNEGMLVINEEEAKTVRLIFFMYLYGYTCQNIADQLTLLERKTKKGNTVWTPGAVLQQLQNERHCGDVLARKTWTPDYLNHKSVKNRQDRNQYRKLDHHEAIISRDDFITVQHMISNAKYGSKGILPELHVIAEGALYGFVTIHPKWRFKKSDYLNACQSAYGEGEIILNPPLNEIHVDAGDFDLRDFEVARTQFFTNQRMMSITFSHSDLKFSINCIHKMPNVEFVELLINPKEHLLAVRPAKKESKTAVQWKKTKGF